MAIRSDYTAGTVTVSAGGTVVTGVGTGWLAAEFQEGDVFIADGWRCNIASVDSNTQLTLDEDGGTRGGALAGAEYRLRYMSNGSRVSAQARELIDMLGASGNLQALGGINGSNGDVPYFTGPGTLGVLTKADITMGVRYDAMVDTLTDRDAYDGQPVEFTVLVADTGDGRAAIYVREGGAGNWSAPAYITGPSLTLDVDQVDPLPYGDDPTVTLNSIAGGYELNFGIPQGMEIVPGTVTTLTPGSPATVDFVPVTGGYQLNFGLPKGDTGTLTGLTPFYQTQVTTAADAAAARTGLGAVGGPASAGDGQIAVFDGATGALIKDSGLKPEDIGSVDQLFTDDLTGDFNASEKAQARANIGITTSGNPDLFVKATKREVAFTRTGNGTISVKAGTIIEVDGEIYTYTSAAPVTMPALVAGTDYAIWIKPDGSLEATSDHISPPLPGSRKLGGFHYAPGGNAAAQAGGDSTPQINPFSIWDLKFRPTCTDPRGMSLIADEFWCDIYLLGVDHHINGTSRYNVTIADGSSPPKMPTMFGGNGSSAYSTLTWFEAAEVMKSHAKQLLDYAEFAAAMYGTTEGSGSGTDPVSTILRQAYTSKWGIMLATGNLWVWGRDFGGPYDGAASYVSQGRGGAYNLSDAAQLGGSWANGADSGSRASAWLNLPSYSSSSLGARGRCDHLNYD